MKTFIILFKIMTDTELKTEEVEAFTVYEAAAKFYEQHPEVAAIYQISEEQ